VNKKLFSYELKPISDLTHSARAQKKGRRPQGHLKNRRFAKNLYGSFFITFSTTTAKADKINKKMSDVCNDNNSTLTRIWTIHSDYKYERKLYSKAQAYDSKTSRTSLDSRQKTTL